MTGDKSSPRGGHHPTAKMLSDYLMEKCCWEPFRIPFVLARSVAFFGKRGSFTMRLAVDMGSSHPANGETGPVNREAKLYRLQSRSEVTVQDRITTRIYEAAGVSRIWLGGTGSPPNLDFTVSLFSRDDLLDIAGKTKGYLDPRNLPYADRAKDIAGKTIRSLDPRGWGNPLNMLTTVFGCLSVRDIKIGGTFIMKMADLVQIRTLSNLLNFLVNLIKNDLAKWKLMIILKKIIVKYDPRKPEDLITIVAAFYAFLSYFIYETSDTSISERLRDAVDKAAPEFLELSDELMRLNGSAMECVKAYLLGRKNADPKAIQQAIKAADSAVQEAAHLAQTQTED